MKRPNLTGVKSSLVFYVLAFYSRTSGGYKIQPSYSYSLEPKSGLCGAGIYLRKGPKRRPGQGCQADPGRQARGAHWLTVFLLKLRIAGPTWPFSGVPL